MNSRNAKKTGRRKPAGREKILEKKNAAITLIAHTNLDEVKKKIEQIETKVEEASSMIKELASEGILVEFEVER